MNKKTLQKIFFSLALIVLIAPVMVAADDFGAAGLQGKLDLPYQQAAGEDLIYDVINLILGFLALIAIVIILIAGFEWMTAGGNDKRVETAQKRLKYGLIGLIIIFFAYGIVRFVISTLTTIGS